MKKLALVIMLGLSTMACRAQVKIAAVEAPAPPPPAPEPTPEPPPAPMVPVVGEQLTLPDQIEFETDEARIKQTPKTLASLEQLAELMKKNPQITKLRIEGHTDNRGKAKRNEKLSKARAEAVMTWLSQHEIASSRMTTQGFGARRPLVANDTEAHRQQNRRTEYYVDEVDGKKVAPDAKVAAGTTAAGGKTKN